MGPLRFVKKAEDNEDKQGSNRGGDNTGQGRLNFSPGQWFAEMGKLLEGIPQENKGKNLKLFAHRSGHRMGQAENKAHHLKAEQQVKSLFNGGKVGKGKMGGKRLGHKMPPVQLDKNNGRDKETYQHRGKKFHTLLAFQMQLDPIKKKACPYHKVFHTVCHRASWE
jgi:hypothetical protein